MNANVSIRGLTVLICASGLAGCGGDGGTGATTGAITFWKDVAPLYNTKCVACHQEGGIAPFPLDNYGDARAHAALELARVSEGTMPPYFMVHDGSCGSFHDENTLTASEKAIIASWVNGGQPEGTRGTPLVLPAQPALKDAVDVVLPTFAPVALGTQVAEFDEYRCFPMDLPATDGGYLTGYAVTPGDLSIVHHVLAFVVDPEHVASGGMSNAAVMRALDEQSPDRPGWPCFGGAGEGVDPTGLPVTWAPGQGVVEYPRGMGVPIRPTDKLVVQVHYNLADRGSLGKTDSTTVHLRFARQVTRQLAFTLPDPFLESLARETPDTLPPRRNNTAYTWTLSGAELGIDQPEGVDLVAVMPHMHGRGVRQKLRLGGEGNLACAAHLENWNFHWQSFYFYDKNPPHITPTTQVELTCEYDTRNDDQPIRPGWGTGNEMCLAVLMLAL